MSLCLLISATVGELVVIPTQRTDVGILLITLVLLFLISFTGFLTDNVPVYFRWIARISYLNYCTAATLQNELTGLYLNGPDGELVPAISLFEEFQEPTCLTMWGNIGVLFGILAGCKLLGATMLQVMQYFQFL